MRWMGVDDRVAVGNRQRAAGAEVVLHVDDDENVVRVDPHQGSWQKTRAEVSLCRGR